VIAASDRKAASPEFRFDRHPRSLDDHLYVYAVLSRRAGGVSIGVNLSPDKRCNFHCVYCQVDRSEPAMPREVDTDRLLAELEATLVAAREGRLGRRAADAGVSEAWTQVADVAFSGDGEPTSFPRFDEVVRDVGQTIERVFSGLPMTLITNASLFHLERVRRGLDEIARRGGRVWAKLDAGSELWYRRVADTDVPFARVLENIKEEARRRAVTIQSLFPRVGSDVPDREEIDAYVRRLVEIVDAGGTIEAVQITTVARAPRRSDVRALPARALNEIAALVRDALPGVTVSVHPAVPPGGGRGEDAS
jgi:wyosine [tRNA(Phe)-imidazoG37] synthetase (radical SAM superfamily)